MEDFGNWLGKVTLVICAVVFVLYGIHSGDWLNSLLGGVALAVAAIPEGLTSAVTICLAIGITQMSKHNAIIKKLHSVETLGCTTVICSDKTGTLTKNEMTVRGIWAGENLYTVTGSGYAPEGRFSVEDTIINPLENPDLELVLRIGVLCNDANLYQDDQTQKWSIIGDPTEGCLISSAWKAGLPFNDTNIKYPRIGEIPFDSLRKRMTTINMTDNQEIAYVKGAVEILLDLCSQIQINSKILPITSEYKKEILTANNEMARQALRPLGFAYRYAGGISYEIETMETDLIFVGIQFMIDPPRDEVKVAIQDCKNAGITVKMITGYNLLTATAIAQELEIIQMGDIAHEGKDIPDMSAEDIFDCNVYARVLPEHKQNIVKALQDKNQVVAITGDGVNDAPG